jgi:aminoglycoside 2'-N-acetyltransferase I
MLVVLPVVRIVPTPHAVQCVPARQHIPARMVSVMEIRTAHTADLDAETLAAARALRYAARGWRLWQGPSFALTPEGITPTEDDDGGIYVLPVTVAVDLSGELICDWRDGGLW